MEQFICVRMIQANGVDLSWFQLDYDQTFAVFFMNADRTIYGRYGTRSDDQEATREMSLEGFRQSMAGALELHKDYPRNKASLAGKQGSKPRFDRPELFPGLSKFKSELPKEGKIVPSCIHCHQVRDEERLVYRQALRPVPPEVLQPYPLPDVVGLHFDPRERATIQEVLPNSAAAQAGFQAGDEMLTLEAQPILSTADVQWILQHANPPARLNAEVRRNGQTKTLPLPLAANWRESSDISWRVSTWDLRRMVTGGILFESLTDAERAKAKLPKAALGLRAQHVGEYGEHAVAKKAGVKPDDILIRFDGQTRAMTESELIAYALTKRMKGEKVPITVLRGEQQHQFELLMQ